MTPAQLATVLLGAGTFVILSGLALIDLQATHRGADTISATSVGARVALTGAALIAAAPLVALGALLAV